MKKILIATTVLASMATVAAAETGVNINGYGRFGLVHYSGKAAGINETTVHTRLRLNIDATTETDSGVVFGGRIRIQDSNNLNGYNYGTLIGNALLFTEYEGLRVEVGNTNTAFDSAALVYDSEMGLRDTSNGDSRSSYFGYDDFGGADRMGVYASYSINGFSAQASFVTPDQYTSTGVNEELGLALAYSTDLFTVSAAAVQDGAGIANNDIWFIGGAYKATPELTVGLNYIDEGTAALGSTAVLYGNYTMGATTLKAYVANNDATGNLTDTAFGIGADYDLGGAKLTGSIQRDYAEETYADLGVRFNF